MRTKEERDWNQASWDDWVTTQEEGGMPVEIVTASVCESWSSRFERRVFDSMNADLACFIADMKRMKENSLASERRGALVERVRARERFLREVRYEVQEKLRHRV